VVSINHETLLEFLDDDFDPLDDVMTGEEVNALVENRLTTAEDPYPLGQRSLKTRNDRDASSDRVNSSDVRMSSMVIRTDAKQPTDLYCLESCQVAPLGQKFIDLLAEHGKDGKPLACGGKCRSETVLWNATHPHDSSLPLLRRRG
jgi:hypothetical protein